MPSHAGRGSAKVGQPCSQITGNILFFLSAFSSRVLLALLRLQTSFTADILLQNICRLLKLQKASQNTFLQWHKTSQELVLQHKKISVISSTSWKLECYLYFPLLLLQHECYARVSVKRISGKHNRGGKTLMGYSFLLMHFR